MTIECYTTECPYHCHNNGEEGPFCYEKECRKTKGDPMTDEQRKEVINN